MAGPVSDEAVRSATGRDWEGWFGILAAAETGSEWSHRRLVELLKAGHVDTVSAWWRQMIVTRYEQHVGRRRAGQTLDTGFQVGVRRTLDAPVTEAWEALLAPGGLAAWLGADLEIEEGAHYGDPGGAHGQVRVVVPGDRLRLTWQPGDWPRASTLQVRVSSAGERRSVVSFHHEHLPDEAAREAMRTRWRSALDALADAAAG
ncbi:MAG: hypothetical protein GWM90_19695 [Gemmatimonadetes bacterium]|nr:SRPBCC domain-containing protein [Gemmatimonadota bacterium]NIQ56654.1 SRPBCC domain-containing protein [Gemmatimonadota bacterium]NIU76843.1 hypothetical protein [Gammaproteobacteria bacterium]NIX46228.1 hypothetical protein [Gemmatimonadota bacterium]NIY10560.1 hypothetical protein [Gemmatimonadota bacterium]